VGINLLFEELKDGGLGSWVIEKVAFDRSRKDNFSRSTCIIEKITQSK
jgi:hypothetical protein